MSDQIDPTTVKQRRPSRAWAIGLGIAVGLALFPVGVRAAGSLVTIVGPSGRRGSGVKVVNNRLSVGDGKGTLTVETVPAPTERAFFVETTGNRTYTVNSAGYQQIRLFTGPIPPCVDGSQVQVSFRIVEGTGLYNNAGTLSVATLGHNSTHNLPGRKLEIGVIALDANCKYRIAVFGRR